VGQREQATFGTGGSFISARQGLPDKSRTKAEFVFEIVRLQYDLASKPIARINAYNEAGCLLHVPSKPKSLSNSK